jgi:hypothetical protein
VLYFEPQYYPQQVVSIQRQFFAKMDVVEGNPMTFNCIKILPDFERVSSQMLRLADISQSKGQPIVNYEFAAFTEFNQNTDKYSLNKEIKTVVERLKKRQTNNPIPENDARQPQQQN